MLTGRRLVATERLKCMLAFLVAAINSFFVTVFSSVLFAWEMRTSTLRWWLSLLSSSVEGSRFDRYFAIIFLHRGESTNDFSRFFVCFFLETAAAASSCCSSTAICSVYDRYPQIIALHTTHPTYIHTNKRQQQSMLTGR